MMKFSSSSFNSCFVLYIIKMKFSLFKATIVFSIIYQALSIPTTWKYSQGAASWDISALLTKTGHKLDDVRERTNPKGFDYYYQFNIGGNMDIPEPKKCKNTTGSDGSWSTSPAPAFQVNKDAHSQCHRLGGDVKHDENWFIDVIDADFPSQGLVVSYLNGDKCHTEHDVHAPRRALAIVLECVDDDTPLPTEEEVDEMVTCLYVMRIKSVHGCPLECPRFSDAVCSRHGECGWDQDLKKANCVCDEGWYGDACEFSCDSSLCGNRGHCEYDQTSKSAHCFCDNGRTGKFCELDTTGFDGHNHGAASGWLWFFMFMSFCSTIGLWIYHRRTVDEPVIPCVRQHGAPTYSSFGGASASGYNPPNAGSDAYASM